MQLNAAGHARSRHPRPASTQSAASASARLTEFAVPVPYPGPAWRARCRWRERSARGNRGLARRDRRASRRGTRGRGRRPATPGWRRPRPRRYRSRVARFRHCRPRAECPRWADLARQAAGPAGADDGNQHVATCDGRPNGRQEIRAEFDGAHFHEDPRGPQPAGQAGAQGMHMGGAVAMPVADEDT
jgi:hypothetical protein